MVSDKVKSYKYCTNKNCAHADPRVKDWFLMDNPFCIIGVISVYLYFVLHKGPQLMKNRQPFNVDKIMIVYNFFQIIACFYLVEEVRRLFDEMNCK